MKSIILWCTILVAIIAPSIGQYYGGDDNNYGEAYEYNEPSEEEEVAPRSRYNSRQQPSSTQKPKADVQYEVSLEDGGDYDDQHPALKKYGTYYSQRELSTTTTTTQATTTTTRRTTRRTTRATTTTTTTTAAALRTSRGRLNNSKNRQTTALPETTSEPPSFKPSPGQEVDDDEPKGNLLVYLDYRREDRSCPEGYVLDIYGYCREIFHEENRDWNWWTNIRNFVFGTYDSGYLSSY